MPRSPILARLAPGSPRRGVTTKRRQSSFGNRQPAGRMALAGPAKTRRKFLRIFPRGFQDEDYVDLERSYKWNAHLAWQQALDETSFRELIKAREFEEIARRATRIESRTNLLFSFEKMALRDAVKSTRGAELFVTALFRLLYDKAPLELRFNDWIDAIGELPRKQTRVLTWPLVTVFGFIAKPKEHLFFKPTVTREAARRYGFDLNYTSQPDWTTYRSLLRFAANVRSDLRDLRPRDMIDIQSFLWVQGSDEYPD
jgi:hypothetical protein